MKTAGSAHRPSSIVEAPQEDLATALGRRLRPTHGDGGDDAWRPLLMNPDEPEGRAQLRRILAGREFLSVRDTLEEQLQELVDTRSPSDRLDDGERRSRAEAHRGSTPAHSYGSWAYYPWSRSLVHVLPEEEFQELRTSRNRNKITADEQSRLALMRIGIVGLSVGQASALTLAMEGIGGTFLLADFDHLSLSNLNRLRAGVHAIGVNKAVLTARAIYEINPYADVRLFPAGVTEEGLDDFLRPDGRALDLVVEECDDFYMKLRVREAARDLSIPVVMETSDRGMIDIERFDLEPDRPLFHGVMRDLTAERFQAMDAFEKSPLALELIGGQDISPRLAASGIELQQSLSTWPQLASAVALGGAVVTNVVRRIGLGQLRASGRYYVDLDRLVVDGSATQLTPAHEADTILPEAQATPATPVLAPADTPRLSEQQARRLIAYAVMAPSGGNAQPWRFVLRGNRLDVYLASERSEAFLDFRHLASHLALGAVAANIELAARELGFRATLERPAHPNPDGPTFIAHLVRSEGIKRDDALFEQIPRRTTNRKIGPRVPLGAGDAACLEVMAAESGAGLRLLTESAELEALAEILGPTDRLRFMSKRMHGDLVNEVRWSADETSRTRDGLDIATLELSPMDHAGLKLASAAGVMDLVARVGGGKSLERPTRAAVRTASAVGLLTIRGALGPDAMLGGGRALQRVWLAATARGYAFQPLTSIVCLFWRMACNGEGLSDAERQSLTALRGPFEELFGTTRDDTEILLFRVARCAPPTARALRRHVDDVLTVDRTNA